MIELNRSGVDFKVVESTLELDNFWRNIYPNWEQETYMDIVPLLHSEKTFLDIGAWQGPISLVAQKYSKQCICFEPDPVAYSNLVKNVEINNFTNIITENLAVSTENSLTIGHVLGLGDGISSYLNTENSVSCSTISIGDILTKYDLDENNISVIKIDIEGYEVELIQDTKLIEMKNKGVPIHLSIHPFFFENQQEYYSQIEKFVGSTDKFQYGREYYEILINA
jgi:FkbM family methyltransferase